MLLATLFVIAGLILLTLAGDKLVEGAAGAATKMGVSTVFIGIVIIGFGTSLPEMLATMVAAFQGQTALALGNIVGSNIANVGLILGLALLLASGMKPLPHNRTDYLLMLAALVFFILVLNLFGILTAVTGLLLFAVLCGYLYLSYLLGHAPSEQLTVKDTLLKLTLFIVFGLVGLAVGAHLLVTGATDIATALGVSPKVIGITMVAIGTSLPELAATIAAVRKGQLGLTVGNILGSNVFNVLGAAGLSAMVAPIPLGTFNPDFLWMLTFALIAFPLFMAKTVIPLRLLGGILLILYCSYIYILVLS